MLSRKTQLLAVHQAKYMSNHNYPKPTSAVLLTQIIGAECIYITKQKPGLKAGAIDSLSSRLRKLHATLHMWTPQTDRNRGVGGVIIGQCRQQKAAAGFS